MSRSECEGSGAGPVVAVTPQTSPQSVELSEPLTGSVAGFHWLSVGPFTAHSVTDVTSCTLNVDLSTECRQSELPLARSCHPLTQSPHDPSPSSPRAHPISRLCGLTCLPFIRRQLLHFSLPPHPLTRTDSLNTSDYPLTHRLGGSLLSSPQPSIHLTRFSREKVS